MLNIHIVCVGKIKENYLKDALNEYSKRLSKYCKLDFIELPDEKIPDKLNPSLELDIKEKEAKQILSHLPKDSYKIALDLKQFNLQEKVIKSRIILYTLTRLFGSSKGIEMVHIEYILKLCNNNIGNKYLTPNKNLKIFIKKQKIYISKV